MICPNCGFTNQPGDEFCGNCGTYLGFANEPAADGQGQPAGQQGPTGQSGTGYPTGYKPSADSPTTVQPVVPPIPPIPPSGGGGTQPVSPSFGRASDIICWNCGRRNPAGRAFCMQCGTKLTTGAAAGGAFAGGAAGTGPPVHAPQPEPAGDGGGGKMLAIGAAFIALLVLAGLGTALLLGAFNGPTASPTLVAAVSPSAQASASGFPSLSPGFGSPSASGLLPTVPATVVGPTIPPPATVEPTRTPRPTCNINGAPRGCRPSPMPSPTVQPTPVNCLASAQADRSVTLTTESPTRTIPESFAWCVHNVTFTNLSIPGATGTLKLYLENQEFIGPPGNYGMAKIGWPGSGGACEASIENNFASSTEYSPDCTYPNGYEYIPGGTIVSFEIVGCGTNGTCNGSVRIDFERGPQP